MAPLKMKYAQLDDASLSKVHVLEEQTGSVVLVMEAVHPVAKLDEAQIRHIQDLERDLGVILIAYQRDGVKPS
jgi:hypothetical protein